MDSSVKEGAKPRKKKKFLTRFFQFTLVFVLAVVLFLVLLITAFHMIVPTSLIKKIASQQVEKNLGSKLSINKIYINPLSGVELTDIKLEKIPGDSNAVIFPVNSASIHKVVLKYSFRELLHKRILINEIIVDTPQLNLFVNLVVDTTAAVKSDTVTVATIPVIVDLEMLRLKNAQFNIVTVDTTITQKIYLADLDVYIDKIHIPTGNVLEKDSLLTGTAKITCEKADFSFEQLTADSLNMRASGNLDLNVDLSIQSLSNITLDVNVILDKLYYKTNTVPGFTSAEFPYPLSLQLTSTLNYHTEDLFVTPLILKVGSEQWLSLDVEAHDFMPGKQPRISAIFKEGRIPVSQIFTLASLVVPDSLIPEILFHNDSAAITFSGTQVSGFVPDNTFDNELNFLGNVKFLDFGVTLNNGDTELDNLNLYAYAAGALNFIGITRLEAGAEVSFDSVFYALSDTLQFYTGAGKLTAKTRINKQMVPEFADVVFSVANVIGAKLDGMLSLTGTNSLETVRGSAKITLENMDTKNLPEMPLSTNGALFCNVKINSLDTILANIKFVTDSLRVPMEFETESFPSINFLTDIECAVDTTFQNVEIRKVNIQLNDIMDAKAHGKIAGAGTEYIQFSLDDLRVFHPALFQWLPNRVQEQFQDLVVTGVTHVNAKMNGQVKPDIMDYNASANIYTEKMSVKYPTQALFVGGIKLNVTALASLKDGNDINVVLQIDSTQTDNVRKDIFRNNLVSMHVFSKDFTSVLVDNGVISFPDLQATGSFSAIVTELATSPIINADVKFNQSAPDTLRLTRDLVLRGFTDIAAHVRMDTVFADLKASLRTKDLTVFLPMETRIIDINTDIKFEQTIDLKKQVFLENAKSPIITPTDGSIDYYVYQAYYDKSLENLSHIKIAKVEAGGYELENINIEAYLGNGRVELPTFFGNLYGGNFGGRFSLDLAQGDLTRASYKFSATFSGINSDLMIKKAPGEKSRGIINANADFSGSGLDITKRLELGGHFYITEIGSKVADNLLRSLDPEGVDSGIRSTRLLINRGFKPKLFSFVLRHGYCYPSVQFSQPWYFPMKLGGGQVELSRIPIEFFIKTALAQSLALKAE